MIMSVSFLQTLPEKTRQCQHEDCSVQECGTGAIFNILHYGNQEIRHRVLRVFFLCPPLPYIFLHMPVSEMQEFRSSGSSMKSSANQDVSLDKSITYINETKIKNVQENSESYT